MVGGSLSLSLTWRVIDVLVVLVLVKRKALEGLFTKHEISGGNSARNRRVFEDYEGLKLRFIREG